MKTIAFFNNKGGVGKTSLVYHLAWLYAELGHRVVAADFDPQANLTTMFLPEDELEKLWSDDSPAIPTIFGIINPFLEGVGDIAKPNLQPIDNNLNLLAGDLRLSTFEDKLSEAWPRCLDRKKDAFRVISAFYRTLRTAAQDTGATLVLIDVGPNLGAINRAALIAADYVIIPLAPDLFSLQGLKNLGPRLREWRTEWQDRLNRNPSPDLPLPAGGMQPLGYVILQHAMRLDRPVKAYLRWMDKIPEIYHKIILDQSYPPTTQVSEDADCLATLKNYRSLMPLAMEAHKPMFSLKPADGAIGSHAQAVSDCYDDFKQLAQKILDKLSINL